MQGEKQGEEENRVKKTRDSSCSLLSHFWSTSRSPFSTFYIPFQSSGSQESNASNGARFGVETKKLQPLQADHSKVINFVDYSLNQGAPAEHESVRHQLGTNQMAPFGKEPNGIANTCDLHHNCACHVEYEIAEEAMNFMSYVVEVSRGWDEPNARDMGRMTSQPNAKGEMYILNDSIDMRTKFATMEKRFEKLER
ncbi:hypothetical protein AAG906_022768 [Vitis piasezkii]